MAKASSRSSTKSVRTSRAGAGNGRHATGQPRLGQRGREIQAYGSVRLLPIALSAEARIDSCQALNEILADRERFKEAAAAWDAFGAMWMLSQRAMKRVALDLAAQVGVSEEEVVARALVQANAVLNGDGVDLGGLVAEAQLAHIERHKPFLRKQFR